MTRIESFTSFPPGHRDAMAHVEPKGTEVLARSAPPGAANPPKVVPKDGKK